MMGASWISGQPRERQPSQATSAAKPPSSAQLAADEVPSDIDFKGATDEVFADPHVRHRDMAVEVAHPQAGRTRGLGIPYKLSATPGGIRRSAPRLGEHTDEVLRKLGYDEAAIRELHARRIAVNP